jgi:hypothetical protein
MKGSIRAAQYRALNMRYHQRNMMKQPVDSICKMCYIAEEHIKHFVVGCTFAPPEYANGHGKVAG